MRLVGCSGFTQDPACIRAPAIAGIPGDPARPSVDLHGIVLLACLGGTLAATEHIEKFCQNQVFRVQAAYSLREIPRLRWGLRSPPQLLASLPTSIARFPGGKRPFGFPQSGFEKTSQWVGWLPDSVLGRPHWPCDARLLQSSAGSAPPATPGPPKPAPPLPPAAKPASGAVPASTDRQSFGSGSPGWPQSANTGFTVSGAARLHFSFWVGPGISNEMA